MIHHAAAVPRRRAGEIDELICTILTGQARPLSAYDIAGQASQDGRRVVPAQVYRTLARLVRQGRVLRIEMLGAYVPRPASADLCLVCLECHGVQLVENPALRVIHTDATGRRFRLAAAPVEAGGLCGTCADGAPVEHCPNS
ncbi:transcriptional repressor [Sphingomonas sanguinis]|uniref:Transcriptional repressor n=1 Tax=Sphingomonas sanguinis TaxID=33051 RepID=A0ABU5LTI4_9SPHN|nr:transcriptional repressor [Sphingomonas sanguinis]MDZ7283243.1 transcriptional repressor [Sphingomonas sanguinis]QXT35893.1 transcriptional repressor [Sphingomonas sanguinis]